VFAYGGAGPLHAVDVAADCGIPVVVVPQEPGTLCARGMLLTDISFDFVRTDIAEVTPQNWTRVCDLFRAMEHEAHAWLEREHVATPERSCLCNIDARYQGQNFEVVVPMRSIEPNGGADFIEAFHAAHAREYGYRVPERAVEIVNCRLKAIGRVRKAPLRALDVTRIAGEAITGRRAVYHGARDGWIETPIHARGRLPAHAIVRGPALIEEMSSTTLIAPGRSARVDAIGNLVIEIARQTPE
jgi:N-methylhydantoinase A